MTRARILRGGRGWRIMRLVASELSSGGTGNATWSSSLGCFEVCFFAWSTASVYAFFYPCRGPTIFFQSLGVVLTHGGRHLFRTTHEALFSVNSGHIALKADQHTVPLVPQPVVFCEELQVLCGIVDGNHDRHSEHVFGINALPARRGSKFHFSFVFALQFVLMVYNESEVADIIKNEPIVHTFVKLAHTIWKMS